MLVQMCDKASNIPRPSGLIDQVNGRTLLGTQGNIQGQFGGNFMVV